MVYIQELGNVMTSDKDGRLYRTVTIQNVKEERIVTLPNGLKRVVQSLSGAVASTKVVAWETPKETESGLITSVYDGLFHMAVNTVLEGHVQDFAIQETVIEGDCGTTYVNSRSLFVPIEQNDANFATVARQAAKAQGVVLTGAQYASTNQFVAKDGAYNGVPSGAAEGTGDFAE